MPGPTLPNTGVIQGSIQGDSGTWGTIVNNALANYDAHDHTSGKGLRIKTAAINIDGDLSFGSSFAPTNLQRISFASVAALSSNNKSLFVNSSDNELYWRSNSGSNVKLTAGAALNVAAFTGGIGGDYAAVGAVVAFDDSGDRYTFKQNSPGFTWARLASGEVRIFETGSTDAVFVGLAAPAALASSYTATWPLALPGSTSIVQIASTGDISFSNTVPDLKHGDRVLSFSALLGAGQNVAAGGNWDVGTSGNGAFAVSTGSQLMIIPVELHVGDRLKSISFLVFGNGAADVTTTVYSVTSGMAGSSIGTATTTNPAASWATVTIDVTDTTISTLTAIQIEFSANAAGIRIGTINATYDRP